MPIQEQFQQIYSRYSLDGFTFTQNHSFPDTVKSWQKSTGQASYMYLGRNQLVQLKNQVFDFDQSSPVFERVLQVVAKHTYIQVISIKLFLILADNNSSSSKIINKILKNQRTFPKNVCRFSYFPLEKVCQIAKREYNQLYQRALYGNIKVCPSALTFYMGPTQFIQAQLQPSHFFANSLVIKHVDAYLNMKTYIPFSTSYFYKRSLFRQSSSIERTSRFTFFQVTRELIFLIYLLSEIYFKGRSELLICL